MSDHFADKRISYESGGRLLEADVPADPFVLFAAWYAEAAAHPAIGEPNGMALATASVEGRPTVRTVLLKDVDERGFTFFGNYESRKGQELAANPWAGLNFWWQPLQRQVRVEGSVERVSTAESDEYYNSRPHGSRLGSWVSPQSQVIPDRAYLEQRLAALEAQYIDKEPKRPPYWGGWLVRPLSIEFWQGAPHRLHDRLLYTRESSDAKWQVSRLAP